MWQTTGRSIVTITAGTCRRVALTGLWQNSDPLSAARGRLWEVPQDLMRPSSTGSQMLSITCLMK